MDYPVRKPLQHAAPFRVDASGAFWFVTVCAAERGGTPFVDHADVIMDAARHYQRTGKWFLSLFMVMPDHIHMIVHVPVGGDVQQPSAARQPKAAPRNMSSGMVGGDVQQPSAARQSKAAPRNVPLGMVGGDVPAPRNRNTTQCVVESGLRAAEDVRPYRGLAKTIGDFKSYLTKYHALAFQRDFFDTRIRDDAHYAEKWNYIVRNPVARGLVATPREWPHALAFDRATGEERPHR